jgi:hypothetical protein
MSDSTPTPLSTIQRWLKSPFNGERWPVPPDMTPAMYDAIVQRGFEPIEEKPKRKDKA